MTPARRAPRVPASPICPVRDPRAAPPAEGRVREFRPRALPSRGNRWREDLAPAHDTLHDARRRAGRHIREDDVPGIHRHFLRTDAPGRYRLERGCWTTTAPRVRQRNQHEVQLVFSV